MRVLLVSPAAALGGAERCLLDCIVALRDSGQPAEVELLALADGPLLEKARALGVRTIVLEPPSEFAELGESGDAHHLLSTAWLAPRMLSFCLTLRRMLIASAPDVVHTNGMKAHLLAGAFIPPRARLVIHLHDFIGARRVSKWFLPALAQKRSSAVFMANSHAVATDFRRLAPKADIRTVYNVVDTEYFRPDASEPGWLAQLANLEPPPPDTVSFGLVATYARWKGHELFIQAAGRLLAANPARAVRFYVVGGPIYKTKGSQVSEQELRMWAKEAGIEAHFGVVPFQEDIARVYRSLNVVVHASTKPEPFGRTIVEAMACGRAVLAAQAGGALELFQHGENALGFTPGNSVELYQAMCVVLNESERQRLGVAARSDVVSRFNSSRLPRALLAVYRDGRR